MVQPDGYRRVAGDVWVRPDALSRLAGADAYLFDIDGVLVDTSASYPEVIVRTVTHYLGRISGWPGEGPPLVPGDTAWFKQAGGFNSDWDLARAATLYFLALGEALGRRHLDRVRDPADLQAFCREVAQAGGGLVAARSVLQARVGEAVMARALETWDPGLIETLCCEYYARDDAPALFGIVPRHVRGPGLYRRERALVTARDLPPGRLGIYTGRAASEALPALELCGLSGLVPPEAVITADSGHLKPDPGGLQALVRVLSPSVAVYFGDNLDDARAAQRYRQTPEASRTPVLFCGLVAGQSGAAMGERFRETGAEMLAARAVEALRWLRR